MQMVLPAKLKTFCQSYECYVCAVSHMLYSYLLGVTLIIHVASYLPVTSCDSLLTVFCAAVHMSVSPLCVPQCLCKHLCVLHMRICSPLFPDVCLKYRYVVIVPICM